MQPSGHRAHSCTSTRLRLEWPFGCVSRSLIRRNPTLANRLSDPTLPRITILLTRSSETRDETMSRGDPSPLLHDDPGHVAASKPSATRLRREVSETGTVGTSQPQSLTAAGRRVTASNATRLERGKHIASRIQAHQRVGRTVTPTCQAPRERLITAPSACTVHGYDRRRRGDGCLCPALSDDLRPHGPDDRRDRHRNDCCVSGGMLLARAKGDATESYDCASMCVDSDHAALDGLRGIRRPRRSRK